MKALSSVISSACGGSSRSSSCTITARSKKSQPPSPKGSESNPPRITSNVKQNLQFLRLWKEVQRGKCSSPKPATSYRRKKVKKDDLPEDIEPYHDPTTTLYYTNQAVDTAVPVLLVDGYNVCGYWMKLKKHIVNGRLDIARQKLIDELITFGMLREVKVVVVFDAIMSGLPTHKENFAGVDIIYSGESCADAWIEKEIKVSQKEIQRMLQEQRSTSMQGKLLKHNLDSCVVDALKDLRKKLSENGLHS
ncbi:uncharacterized protein LOC131164644 isoform X5 [Malania oleifera]|uniref:uncharacterized protein LOC131164644 isoform X5 n=1 Tax=Malania oleifera TaxID=397392 RepID=UPI0025AE9DEE|nr:uncharacterized protein LOC131164644 isoform X5 [Malania oleifera]